MFHVKQFSSSSATQVNKDRGRASQDLNARSFPNTQRVQAGRKQSAAPQDDKGVNVSRETILSMTYVTRHNGLSKLI